LPFHLASGQYGIYATMVAYQVHVVYRPI